MRESVLRTYGLSKVYDGRPVVDNVTLEVQQGEIYGLLGPNGAGKSTTLRMITGLLPPSRGHVALFGKRLEPDSTALRRRLGVVGEQSFFYDEMTAREYLRFFAELYGVPAAGTCWSELVERLDLSPFLDLLAHDFSQGMKRKLSLVRALQHDPDLIVLDEPVSHLDPTGIRQVREVLEDRRRAGGTVIVSSHILSEVERTADRVGILHKGKLLIEDTVGGVRRAVCQSELVVELAKPIQGVPERIAAIKGVAEVRVIGNRLVVGLEADADLRLAVAQAITVSGGMVLSMEQRMASLEDAFLKFTSGPVEDH